MAVRGTILSLLLLVGAASGKAQTPLGNLVSQVRTATVIVNTYDERGKALTEGSGFLISPDRVVTNLRSIDSARLIRINTFSGKTLSVQSIIARYVDADLAILQLSQVCLDVIPLKVKTISQANGSAVVLNNSEDGEWNVRFDQIAAGWSFEHTGTHLQISASIDATNEGGSVVKLKGYVNGTAVAVP